MPRPATRRWKEACKFLSGAFFVSAGVLSYLYWMNVPVPIGSTLVAPRVHGIRAMVHAVLFLLTTYLGFVRKPT